jgi:hypothetical protein
VTAGATPSAEEPADPAVRPGGDAGGNPNDIANAGSAETDGVAGSLGRTLRLVAGFIAPTTMIAALFLYFGYVWTDALYEYYGIDAATLQFSAQDYMLRSVQALYVPVGALLLIALVAVWVHPVLVGAVLRYRQSPAVRGTLITGAVIGGALVLLGISAVVFPSWWREESIAAPLFACTGVLLLSYLRSLNRRRVNGTRFVPGDARQRLSAGVVLAFVTLTVFWTANSFAIQYGKGTAITLGAQLDRRPAVILDTTEGLFLNRLPGVQETTLPISTADQKYHFRYRGLRLLAQSGDRMFFVPSQWTPGDGAALMLRDNPDIRVQLYAG